MLCFLVFVTDSVLIEVKQTLYLQYLTVLGFDALIFLVLESETAVAVSHTTSIVQQPLVLSHIRIGIDDSPVASLS